MIAVFRSLLCAFALFAAACASAPPAQAQSQTSQWSGVSRIVVIGDLEGDYEKFADMLTGAGLINVRGDWAGGTAHLVQLGDIPDRGPNSKRIMEHLMRLEPQARRAGGYVHALIGNHEAMNVTGDLRYVHPGEYAAFADRNSARRRNQYYDRTLEYLRANTPEAALPVFDNAFRAQWDAEHPLGYVEHRQGWAPTGELGRWVAGHDSVIRINDTLFVHGGLGPAYATASRDGMNNAVRAALRGTPDPAHPGILTDQDGPLWYRGLSLNEEDAERVHLEALLAQHGVGRIIVGHTKRASTVLPRFDGRVIITDIAVPAGFTDPHAYLVIEDGTLTTVHRGQRVPLTAATHEQTCAYLAAVAALDPPNGPNATRAANCAAGVEEPVAVSPDSGR